MQNPNEYVQYFKNGTVEESYSLVDIPVVEHQFLLKLLTKVMF